MKSTLSQFSKTTLTAIIWARAIAQWSCLIFAFIAFKHGAHKLNWFILALGPLFLWCTWQIFKVTQSYFWLEIIKQDELNKQLKRELKLKQQRNGLLNQRISRIYHQKNRQLFKK